MTMPWLSISRNGGCVGPTFTRYRLHAAAYMLRKIQSSNLLMIYPLSRRALWRVVHSSCNLTE